MTLTVAGQVSITVEHRRHVLYGLHVNFTVTHLDKAVFHTARQYPISDN
jgi:hypothetical protein